MTTPSGQISLSDVNTELGYSATALITMNDAAVRTLAGVGGSGTPISMQDLQNKSNIYNVAVSSNQLQMDLRSFAISAGWNGTAPLQVTINSGVYVYSNNTGIAGLTVTGSFPNGVTLVNNGFILGKGGDAGANSGGPAVSLGVSLTINNTNASAYIGGGGGGGGSPSYGGGGAGGGNGNPSPGSAGGNGSAGGVGGTGGRIIPGTGGAAVGGNTAGQGGGAGGSGTAYARYQVTGYQHIFTCATYPVSTPLGDFGGGGGGWGASGGGGVGNSNNLSGASGAGGSGSSGGGNATTSGAYSIGSGGPGGRAVQLNGYSVTWVSGDTSRVYGAIS